jgi:hypothetical protein
MRAPSSTQRKVRYQALPVASKPGALRRAYARLFKRAEVTTFHRCLALHMHVAAQRSALG